MTEIATIGTFDEATWPGDSPASSRGTVLLIEDEEFVREGASEALRSAGYSVLTARNAAEANQQFREWGQAVDLLLADVVLPDKTAEVWEGAFRLEIGTSKFCSSAVMPIRSPTVGAGSNSSWQNHFPWKHCCDGSAIF